MGHRRILLRLNFILMAASTSLRAHILIARGSSLGRPPTGIDQPNFSCSTDFFALTRRRLCGNSEGAGRHQNDQEQDAKKRDRPQHISDSSLITSTAASNSSYS